MIFRRLPVVVASFVAVLGCRRVPEPSTSDQHNPADAAAPLPAHPITATPAVLGRTPHDRRAFTQGLLFADGAFLESTGGYGHSTLRRVEPATGRVLRSISLPANMFGEGLARLHGELFQLTWQEHVIFVYDEATFDRRRQGKIEGEGWGLTTDGDALVMSDGSPTLRFLDPRSFGVVRTVTVHDGSQRVDQLNELEWVRGEILANLWLTNLIARIDPRSGEVLGYLDLAALPEPPRGDPDGVLNGIAYDEREDRLFVTGKLWASVYQIARPAP
jgi:glutamine cyclotransferase